MPKRFGFKRSARSALMGAGSVLHPILTPRSSHPALDDALALHQDQVVIAGDFWSAIETFDASLESDIANSEDPSDPGQR
jgi:hypothetical protein